MALAALANQAAAAGISFTVASISYDRPEKSGLGDFPMSTCFRPRNDGSLRVIQQILGVRPTVAVPASCASLPPAVARTADSVYLLQPNDAPAPWVHETLRWINEQRGASRTVVGVNLFLYAMPAVPDASVKILDAFARELCAAATRHRLAFILTPHDFRKSGPANLRAVKEKLAKDKAEEVAKEEEIEAKEEAKAAATKVNPAVRIAEEAAVNHDAKAKEEIEADTAATKAVVAEKAATKAATKKATVSYTHLTLPTKA